MVVAITTNAQNVDLKKGLVAYYPFNGNANDESGNRNNGIIYGASLNKDRNGNENSAFYFNGVNNYIKLPELNLTQSFSISLWIKQEKSSSEWASIFTKWNHNGKRSISIGINKNTKLGFAISDSRNQTNSNFHSFNTDVSILNNWTHLVFVYCHINGTRQVYIDKKLINSRKDTPINIFESNATTYIGTAHLGTEGFFKGTIDDVCIYNRALNDKEIQALYRENLIDAANDKALAEIYNYSANNAKTKEINNVTISQINLQIPFSKEFLKTEKPDLSKYQVSIIKKQAKKGDLASLVTYGDMFYYGYDKIERNEVEAILNYKKAADQGNAMAQYKLATIYRQNNATVSDAVKYYNLAVAQNYEPAIYDLAILYLNGNSGISKDYSKAKELLQKIPSNLKAKTELGKLYLSSDITTFNLKADLQMAKSLFQDANQIGIFNEWLNRLDNFGKLRYALSILPTLINGINTEIDFKNETQLKALIDQINQHAKLLGVEKVKKYTCDLIDNLEVVHSTINKQYEDEWYQSALISKSPAKMTAFVNRFPNSTYRKSMLDEITNFDNEKFNQSKNNNTKYSYQQYLELFPLGLNADEARNKIKQIEQEEKLALEKQQEEERQAKIKAQQDKANAEYEYEQNRKNRIKNASVGDRLCFSQGWTRTESFFFIPYTAANYTMSIICFIERKEGENYQVRIADVSSSKSGEYSSPNINGVKVNKGDVIWVKPLNDSKWHKCD
jgi:hypothetical protein